MGVMCQILLNKTKEGFFRPGQHVSGTVKYAIDEETEFKDISVKLHGSGYCRWTERVSKDRERSYRGSEEYVNLQTSILKKGDTETVILPVGSYEHSFDFIIPNDIPSTYRDIHCTISYYIQTTFNRPGIFKFAKRFKIEIPIRAYIKTDLPIVPTIYGLEKTLFKLFSSKTHIVKLKAEVEKSVLSPGEGTTLNFDITNDTDVIIPSIKVELTGTNVYKAHGGKTRRRPMFREGCTVHTPSIPDNGTAKLSTTINSNLDYYTIQNTWILQTEYRIDVTVRLPMPHFNACLEIPIVIGDSMPEGNLDDVTKNDVSEDPPPSYWEVMAEDDDNNEKCDEEK